MARVLSVTAESFPIAGTFAISRGSKTTAEVVVCRIQEGEIEGWGECVPYLRYGESVEFVCEQISAIAPAIARGMTRNELMVRMPAGAARNAVDCALWDLEAKLSGERVSERICRSLPEPLVTAYTISLDTPSKMADIAALNSFRPLLKIKLGAEGDVDRMKAISAAVPNSKLIVDANEGWNESVLEANLQTAATCGIALIEQPLPAGRDQSLERVSHAVPICADESVHTIEGLGELLGRYDAVNIKLDKTGGLTAATVLKERARGYGFGVMVGCMLGTSLGMAPAVLLAQDADFVDLDGPLLLARDRIPALKYDGSLVFPPAPQLWG